MNEEKFLNKLLLTFAKWLSMCLEIQEVFQYRRWTFVETCSFLCDWFHIFISWVVAGGISRSSRPEVLCKKRCSWKFCKFRRKTSAPESLF